MHPASKENVWDVTNEFVTSACTISATSSGRPSRPTGTRGELLARIFIARQRLTAFDQGVGYGVNRDAVRRQGPAREQASPMRVTFEAV